MPKFYCEYCGIYLTHSSPSGRKQHSKGKKHENARQDYYRAVMQDLVDQLKACFQKNMIPTFLSRDTIRRLLMKHQNEFQGLSTTAFVETIDSLQLNPQKLPMGPLHNVPPMMAHPGMQMPPGMQLPSGMMPPQMGPGMGQGMPPGMGQGMLPGMGQGMMPPLGMMPPPGMMPPGMMPPGMQNMKGGMGQGMPGGMPMSGMGQQQ